MPDPLSVAASSFAVVGVADVVLRACVECCRFLSEIKDAPAEISKLRTSIREYKELAQTLNKYLEDLQESTSSIPSSFLDSNIAPEQFRSSVRALERELNALLALAKKHNKADKTWGRVKWLFDERRLNKSLERLEQSKSTLSVALSLVEGRRAALGQKSAEEAVQQNLQRMTLTICTQSQELSAIKESQNKVLARQEKVVLHSKQQLKKTRLVQKDLLKASRATRIEHERTRGKIVDGNQRVIKTISAKIDDFLVAIPKAPTVARKSNREIWFIGESRETLLTPLLLMKDDVERAILHVLSHYVKQVSLPHLYWFQSEFNNLISSATQEAAALCPGSTATSFDQWKYPARAAPFFDKALLSNASASRDDGDTDSNARESLIGSHEIVRRRGSRSVHKVFSSSSRIGQLHLAVPRITNKAPIIDEAQLFLIPSAVICSTSVRARLVRSVNFGSEPKICAQLNTLRLVQDAKPHDKLFRYGSLEDIDAAFRKGIISPYDQDREFGFILCLWCAASYQRQDVLRYLDSQGIGLSALNGESDVLHGFWMTMRNGCTDDSSNWIISYLEENTTACITSNPLSPLHSFGLKRRGNFSEEYVRQIRRWMDFLKRNDFDFEFQDERGNTPLLDHLRHQGEFSLAMARLLLEFGANPHASNLNGENAIHLAISSNVWYDQIEVPEILEERLSLLIEAGVDIHHRDNWGYTPSYCARRLENCWAVWCRALERNGKNIEEILQEDGELWLLEESSEDESDEEESDEDEGDEDEGDEDESDEEDSSEQEEGEEEEMKGENNED